VFIHLKMNLLAQRIICIPFIILCLSAPGLSQLNINIGYSGSWFQKDNYNRILRGFNNAHPVNDRTFGNFNYHNGILLGTKYNFGAFNLEFDYVVRMKLQKAAVQELPVTTPTNYKMNYFQHALTGAIEIHGGSMIGVGAGIEWNLINLRTRKNDDVSLKQINQSGVSLNIFTNIYAFKGEKMGFSFRPFIQIPFFDTNLSSLQQYLDPGNLGGSTPETLNSRSLSYGIMLIIHNGPQN